MKKLIFLLIISVFLVACSSSSKHLKKGNYDAALQKAAKKIKNDPGKFEEVYVFNDAYENANHRDHRTLLRLKKQGNPANWSKIYNLLVKMNARQELASSLPSVGIVFEEHNYDNEIKEAKVKAAEYAYAKGIQLLKMNDRFEARKAYSRFLEVKKYDATFKDINQQLAKAERLGATNVFFTIKNNSGIVAPNGLIQEIKRIDVDDLDKKWMNYDNYTDTNKIYHYSVILNIKLIAISPEQLKENTYTESKEIEDGFDYVLDENGNVKKDTLGNDIKIPKLKTISCTVKEFHQQKTVRISGTVDYFNNATRKLMKSEPIAADAIFEHHYANANGNLNALTTQTHKKLGIDPLPFPDDISLLLQTGDALKATIKEMLVRHKNYLK